LEKAMSMVTLTINGETVEASPGTTILEAARSAGIYIPTLCHHPDLPPARGSGAAKIIYQGTKKTEDASNHEPGQGCGLCLVEVEGEAEPVGSCAAEVRQGISVITESGRIKAKRQENLIPILARHPHACLTCAQQEGCSRSQCSLNVPENERCCTLLGHCELQRVAGYIGISSRTPKWVPTTLAVIDDEPLFARDYNLCIGCTRCVRACRDLRGIEAIGFVRDADGLVQVGSLAPTLEESGCKYCTACVEVCPTGALMDKAVRPGRKSEDLVPCRGACPAHIDVPGYLRLIAAGKRDEANAVIRERVPFPGILGRACVRPCEEKCRRAEVNEAIAICALKRYAADGDQGLWKKGTRIEENTGKKVAVIGSGPSGLTAAFYLRKKGHAVTVFEGQRKAGGMMRYGIPRYCLPEELLDREIKDIFALGVEFRPNQVLGKDFTLERLRAAGYDAVFLGVGAQRSRRIPLEGADSSGVWWGVDFLARVAGGEKIRLKERVIVIGGGRVAMDVALTSLRCGAGEVTMVCVESGEEMQAHGWEIQGALAEGVRLVPSWGPHRVLRDNGRVTGMEIIHCVSAFDDQGAFNPEFDDVKKTIEGDEVILAVGQAPDLSFLGKGSPIATKDGLILVKEATLETGMRGVYAGGDVAAPAGTIIHAVAAGRKAAASIDKALGGTGDIDEKLFERGAPSPYLGRDEGFAGWRRGVVPELDPGLRHRGFEEVSLGYGDEEAKREAKRCFQCDLRLLMGRNPGPPEKRLAFREESAGEVPEAEGVLRIYDADRHVLAIKGTADLRKEFRKALKDYTRAAWLDYHEDKLYSKKESELIQKYLREHGKMPGEGAEEEDLF
jgi:NADPH-dependent glutamate synthase beta subunit-like oxidoreductase